MFPESAQFKRTVGCILGGAIGDAHGFRYEGRSSSSPPLRPASSLSISDDTQLTLATCEAILECEGEVHPSVIAEHFVRWHRSSKITGMGASTYQALSSLAQGGHWALVGRKGDRAAGNGAAMRIAPLAFCLNPLDPKDRKTIHDVSYITHHSEEAYAGALAVVIAIRGVFYDPDTWDGRLLSVVTENLPDTQIRDRIIEIMREQDCISITAIGNKYGTSGYVVESVPLALFAASRVRSQGFRQIIEEIISLGGDTDTIASIAGQLMGTFLGRQGLSEDMLSNIRERKTIERISFSFGRMIHSKFRNL